MKLFFLACAASLGVAGVAGCASSAPPPNDQFTAAQLEIGRAETTAPNVPDAKLHLQLAEENLQKSKALIGHDNRRAASLIAVANVEAELASTLARAAREEDSARMNREALQKVAPPAPAAPSTPAPTLMQGPTPATSPAPATK